MFCSTSIGLHLLRGFIALALIFGAFFFSSYGTLGLIIAVLAFAAAIFLMRGCPMCWLMGLFETIRRRQDKNHRPSI